MRRNLAWLTLIVFAIAVGTRLYHPSARSSRLYGVDILDIGGVRLGMSEADVIRIRGGPRNRRPGEWDYANGDSVVFRHGLVQSLTGPIVTYASGHKLCQIGDSGEEVESNVGAPPVVVSEATRRYFDSPRGHLDLSMSGSRVLCITLSAN